MDKSMWKEKVRHRLYAQVYVYFSAIVVIFTLLMALIFIKLYKHNSKSSYDNLLNSQVQVIAERMNRYVLTDDVEDYSVYMEMLEDTLGADIWILSNEASSEPMNQDFVNIQVTHNEMSQEIREVLRQAYLGRTINMSGYSMIHDMYTLTVGAPIYNASEDVVGAVLLIAPSEGQEEKITHIVFLFVISIFVAMGVSLLLAILFTKKLLQPIMKIKKATNELTEHNYNIRTNIEEKNEIGELASSIDILAEKLKQAEVQREYMEQMRKDFFSNISHELRTPITVIRAYVESLVDGVVPEEKIPQYYERMLNECGGIQRLIQDLLLLSKMENPEFQVDKEPINVIQVFEDILRSLRVVCVKKNIKLQMQSEKEYCFLEGDYDRIRQVFLAVIDNAIKFSNFGSTIYIKVASEDKIRIQVIDEGIGMDEEEIKHIFDKFYTKKIPNNKGGSGLGLVIAKEIVKKHNGTIEAVSKKGVGTTFTFTFDQLYLEEDFEME